MSLHSCNSSSACLDVDANITSSARLAVIVRFVYGIAVREEFFKLATLQITSDLNAETICSGVVHFYTFK